MKNAATAAFIIAICGNCFVSLFPFAWLSCVCGFACGIWVLRSVPFRTGLLCCLGCFALSNPALPPFGLGVWSVGGMGFGESHGIAVCLPPGEWHSTNCGFVPYEFGEIAILWNSLLRIRGYCITYTACASPSQRVVAPSCWAT